MKHQYIERQSGRTVTEKPYGDRIVNLFFSGRYEMPPILYRLLTGPHLTGLLGWLTYDVLPMTNALGYLSFLSSCRNERSECLEDPMEYKTAREYFERKISYWKCRPMPAGGDTVVSPADSRMIAGSLSDTSFLFLKDKFFLYEELLGVDKRQWLTAFEHGDYAVFRLTPEKYHFNHTPVAGRVEDFYTLPGRYHSCNPGAVINEASPYSKNKRTVTILNTDVPGGTKVGLVAMIEIVALMIGDIVQCYSSNRYENPLPVFPGMFLEKGFPKSRYRPGSSTDVLLFQKNRIRFAEDLVRNLHRTDVESRYSVGFGRPLVETELPVRSLIATRR